jgi:hypothetical protein
MAKGILQVLCNIKQAKRNTLLTSVLKITSKEIKYWKWYSPFWIKYTGINKSNGIPKEKNRNKICKMRHVYCEMPYQNVDIYTDNC